MAARSETEGLPSYTEAARATNKRRRSMCLESVLQEGEATNKDLINGPRKRKKLNETETHDGIAAGKAKGSTAHGKVVDDGGACGMPASAKRVRRPVARSDSKAFFAKREGASGFETQHLLLLEDELLLVTKPVALTKDRPGPSPSAPSSSAGLRLPKVDGAKFKASQTSPTSKQSTPTTELPKVQRPSIGGDTYGHHPPAYRTAQTTSEVEYELEEGELDPEPLRKSKRTRKLKSRQKGGVVASKGATSTSKPPASTVSKRRSEELNGAKPGVTVAERTARAQQHRTAAAELEDEMMVLKWKMNEVRARIAVHEAKAAEYERQ